MNSVTWRLPSSRQNSRKLPGRSGMVTASTASRCSPSSARSATKRSRSKFMLAPQAMATYVRFFVRCRATHAFTPAIASAPAGSRMERVSSKTSFSAAQMASVSTRTISSTYCRTRRNVSLPTCFTATPSANRPTCASLTRRPASIERAIASESSGCTPITLTSGRTRFTYAAMPLASPPPPIATKIASRGPWCWRRISMPIVPWPGDDVRIVVRMHEHGMRALLQRRARARRRRCRSRRTARPSRRAPRPPRS